MNSPRFSVVIVSDIAQGRFGVFRDNGIPFAVTLERTFEDSPIVQERTVIPFNAITHCVRTHYIEGGYGTFELQIPGHTRVLFHKLNIETQSKACMGIGQYFADFGTDPNSRLYGPGIANAAAGFGEFMKRTQGLDSFDLLVTGDANA